MPRTAFSYVQGLKRRSMQEAQLALRSFKAQRAPFGPCVGAMPIWIRRFGEDNPFGFRVCGEAQKERLNTTSSSVFLLLGGVPNSLRQTKYKMAMKLDRELTTWLVDMRSICIFVQTKGGFQYEFVFVRDS